MANEDPKPTTPETEALIEETPVAQTEVSPSDGPAVSGDTGGGTMPWGDKPGG